MEHSLMLQLDNANPLEDVAEGVFLSGIFWLKNIIYQIVHGTKGHMTVYGPGCHPQNIIWTEAKLRSIYYFAGDRPVHKLPFGSKCHDIFVILYSIHANLSDDMLSLLYF